MSAELRSPRSLFVLRRRAATLTAVCTESCHAPDPRRCPSCWSLFAQGRDELCCSLCRSVIAVEILTLDYSTAAELLQGA